MTASHQTVRLSRGKHGSPLEGACVMELASMLAGEPFSDRPRSVCPAIGAFMRIYNDRLDDERRQDLYAYAARIVGTTAGAKVVDARIRACDEFAREAAARRPRALARLRRARMGPSATPSAAGVAAARAISRIDDDVHAKALAFVDRLIGIGAEERAGALAQGQAMEGAQAANVGVHTLRT